VRASSFSCASGTVIFTSTDSSVPMKKSYTTTIFYITLAIGHTKVKSRRGYESFRYAARNSIQGLTFAFKIIHKSCNIYICRGGGLRRDSMKMRQSTLFQLRAWTFRVLGYSQHSPFGHLHVRSTRRQGHREQGIALTGRAAVMCAISKDEAFGIHDG